MYQPDNAVLSKEMFWVLKENQHREVKLRGEKNDKNEDIGHLSLQTRRAKMKPKFKTYTST